MTTVLIEATFGFMFKINNIRFLKISAMIILLMSGICLSGCEGKQDSEYQVNANIMSAEDQSDDKKQEDE